MGPDDTQLSKRERMLAELDRERKKAQSFKGFGLSRQIGLARARGGRPSGF